MQLATVCAVEELGRQLQYQLLVTLSTAGFSPDCDDSVSGQSSIDCSGDDVSWAKAPKALFVYANLCHDDFLSQTLQYVRFSCVSRQCHTVLQGSLRKRSGLTTQKQELLLDFFGILKC